MTLARLFTILGTVAAVLWLAIGSALYAIAGYQARAEAAADLQFTAETTARNLDRFMALAKAALEQLGEEPEFAQALATRDPSRILAAEEKLTRLVPSATLVRLVPESIEVPDEDRAPKMGFADLDLIRQSRTGKAFPAVQAANTPDINIAMVQHLGQGYGVILASLPPGLLLSSLPVGLAQGAIELRQQNLSLAFVGDAALKVQPPSRTVPIVGTNWQLSYWAPDWVDPGLAWFLVFPILGAVLTGGAAFWTQRFLALALRQDQDNAIKLALDVFAGKSIRRFRHRLKEMQRLSAQLEGLKFSVLETSTKPASTFEPAVTRQKFDLDGSLASLLNSPDDGPHTPEGFTVVEVQADQPPAEEAADAPVAVSPDLFRASDIRGLAGKGLTAKVAKVIGRAIGSEARDRGEYTIAVGRDGRLSSPELSEALIEGFRASGCAVIDLGLVPTPVLSFATHVLNTESGVMVTGSHDGPDWNGFKVVLAGETLGADDFKALLARIEEGAFQSGEGQLEYRNLVTDYLERILHDTQLARPLKVVVDCGNGAGGVVAPPLLEEIGCEVVPLFCDVDGRFPNHPPDPGDPNNLAALVSAVLENGADLGIALDGDGDRLGVVDSSGTIIWPDRQMMVLAADVLSREPGADIIFDVKCTRQLVSHVVRHGGRPLMWRSGHGQIRAKLRETGALLAGDMGGHIFIKERWYGFDDGLYAAARLLEILSNDSRSSAEVFGAQPRSVSAPEFAITLPEGEAQGVLERLRESAAFPDARLTDIDGLRVDFADGWGLVQSSETRSALILRFEGDTEDALHRIKAIFRTLLKRVKPDIRFP